MKLLEMFHKRKQMEAGMYRRNGKAAFGTSVVPNRSKQNLLVPRGQLFLSLNPSKQKT